VANLEQEVPSQGKVLWFKDVLLEKERIPKADEVYDVDLEEGKSC
jgi:hypothetical protein